MYTLAVASLGRRVVAVDMMADNLAFVRRSLGLANISSEAVTLVHNAVTATPGQAAVPVRDTAQGGHTALTATFNFCNSTLAPLRIRK